MPPKGSVSRVSYSFSPFFSTSTSAPLLRLDTWFESLLATTHAPVDTHLLWRSKPRLYLDTGLPPYRLTHLNSHGCHRLV